MNLGVVTIDIDLMSELSVVCSVVGEPADVVLTFECSCEYFDSACSSVSVCATG